jgi:VanZ family protein
MRLRLARDRLLLVVAVVVQLVVLYAPRAPSTGSTPGVDKVVHATVFGAVAWAAVRCGGARWVVAVVLAAHAVLSEVLQAGLLPARSGDPFDAVADVVGVALVLLLTRPGRATAPAPHSGRAPAEAPVEAPVEAPAEATRRA